MDRLLTATLIGQAALLVAHSAMGAESSHPEAVVKPFFAEYCNQSHGEEKQKGDLRTDNAEDRLRVAEEHGSLGGNHEPDQLRRHAARG